LQTVEAPSARKHAKQRLLPQASLECCPNSIGFIRACFAVGNVHLLLQALDNEGYNQIRLGGSGCSFPSFQSCGCLHCDVQGSRNPSTLLLPQSGRQHL
jgi:hypothetical protein